MSARLGRPGGERPRRRLVQRHLLPLRDVGARSRPAVQSVTGATDHIPQKVLDAFTGRATLSLLELARAAEIDKTTLGRHREAGTLPVHVKGCGLVRRHYVCTLADVAAFYRNIASRAEPCRSASRTPLTTTTTFRSAVIGFPARPSAGMNVTLRSGKSGPRRSQAPCR